MLKDAKRHKEFKNKRPQTGIQKTRFSFFLLNKTNDKLPVKKSMCKKITKYRIKKIKKRMKKWSLAPSTGCPTLYFNLKKIFLDYGLKRFLILALLPDIGSVVKLQLYLLPESGYSGFCLSQLWINASGHLGRKPSLCVIVHLLRI